MMGQCSAYPSYSVSERRAAPEWAIQERQLLDTLNLAAEQYVSRYARSDGTLIWREDWKGMDGSDDPYEGFMYLTLLYTLGGSEQAQRLARLMFEGITWQWTEYGQIYREFDGYYDWMHHGEGMLFFYFLGLAEPYSLKDRQRAARFASFYTGDDPEALNYDKERKLIRSPITGSRGPRFQMTEEDWSTHREVLDDYLAPFEDIPGVDYASMKCQWTDDAIYARIIALMNDRMAQGDVPLNLNATSLVTHAYLYEGRLEHKDWVLAYIGAWKERAERNGGLLPDNVGLSGEIGEYMDGKWWGGYYGWRWPHGFFTIMEPTLIACSNAVLLTGDLAHLDLARAQLDLMWEKGRMENGEWVVPNRHFDAGWTDYKSANPLYPIHLWYISMADEDLERVTRVPIPEHSRHIDVPGYSGTHEGKNTKHYIGNWVPWFQYIRGERPDYPERILEANLELVNRQLNKMLSDKGDPEQWVTDGYSLDELNSIHKWQEMCPVYMEGLAQLTLGAPMHLSHGGLQHARVRYYDGIRQRPGLPQSVSALVAKLDAESAEVHLYNLSDEEEREVVLQAGNFGEHRFEQVDFLDAHGNVIDTRDIDGKWMAVRLLPGTGATLAVKMTRYANAPSYDSPWGPPGEAPLRIRGRANA